VAHAGLGDVEALGHFDEQGLVEVERGNGDTAGETEEGDEPLARGWGRQNGVRQAFCLRERGFHMILMLEHFYCRRVPVNFREMWLFFDGKATNMALRHIHLQ
jgi:hypothetical protein